MKKCLNIAAALAVIAAAANQSRAGVDPTGACYTVDTAGFTVNCQGDLTEAECAALLNGVWDEGHMCNDVDGDGIIDPFITYDQIDPVQYGDCGEFTIAGATLFADFFGLRATTNDFVNVDGDTIPCSGAPFKDFADVNCIGSSTGVDQLAPDYFCGLNWHGCWLAQYRSVGSGNGFKEFVNYQLTGALPKDIPAEAGILNRARWAEAGEYVDLASCMANCFSPESDTGDMNGDTFTDGRDIELWITACLSEDGVPAGMTIKGDVDGDEIITIDGDLDGFVSCILSGGCAGASEPGTPYCYSAIDAANLDVPSRWFVTLAGEGAWNKKPTTTGYGNNTRGAADTGYSNKLASLSAGGDSMNFNASPDANTIYDTIFAYSPVASIANQGTGYENVTYTEIQYMLVTGRNANGENIQACTRDSGSGTRNGFTNSVGVDPSWGAGDNLAPLKRNGSGDRARENQETNVGYNTYTANCGGSSIMENAVRHHRLGVGYTGLLGGSRAASDAVSGIYEILNVKKDIAGGVNFVRPSVEAVINNDDVDNGFSIGGGQTLVTRGDPKQMNPAAPDYMDNRALAAYVNNITDSIDTFVANSGALPQFNMPADQLTTTFILPQAVNAISPLDDPTVYVSNAVGFNAGVSAATLVSQATVIPAFGSVKPNGNVPVRNAIGTIPANRGPFEFAEPAAYSDGSTTGAYRAFDGSLSLTGGTQLGPRMHIQGDFNVNGMRDLGDIAPLIAAVADPAGFQSNDITTNAIPNVAPINFIVPEILGDFDGNGDLDKEDVRYFADGLAMVAGKLDRKQGFTTVDTAFGGNYFNTTLAHGAYSNGDSRADVAGDAVYPGAYPNGADGTVDAADIDYVCANMFSTAWGADLSDHAGKDLSCDMTGDCIVNYDDICEIIAILETTPGDINLDGIVNDGAAVSANIGMMNPKWSDGDVDCDGDIDADDVAIADGTNNPCL
ncbi:MAG: hypothetical protein H6819_01530 [Phycisphaerales bacterium]|nr:hypothetical protein [Phycisphaerales bacterium]MCB9857110.1 hypothetical protein [Phycisphaerales bacterium]MCB9861763.1 hypothetical protein [Phycisphaerales bacterium]